MKSKYQKIGNYDGAIHTDILYWRDVLEQIPPSCRRPVDFAFIDEPRHTVEAPWEVVPQKELPAHDGGSKEK